jgi:hypothetical protein
VQTYLTIDPADKKRQKEDEKTEINRARLADGKREGESQPNLKVATFRTAPRFLKKNGERSSSH